MTNRLKLTQENHRMIIDFRLRCLEIATQMIGPKQYPNPNPEASYLDPYFTVSNLIAEHVLICSDVDIDWDSIRSRLDAADRKAD